MKSAIKHITTPITISGVAVESRTARIGGRNHIIGVARLDSSFKVFVNVERNLARIVTQTCTLESVALTLDALHFHTRKKVHDVLVCKGVIVVGCSA